MMETWAVTGCTGFLGRHVLQVLREELADAGRARDRILVLGRRCPDNCSGDSFVTADLDDPEALRDVMRTTLPDHVLHLAGRIPPAPDEDLYRGNFWGTIRLLNALRVLNRRTRVTLAGSAAELGPVPTDDLPVDESHDCNPTEAYGRSKLLATIAGLAERPPLEVTVARMFNPIGPGLPSSQAFGEFATQLATGNDEPLPLLVGDLDARRDFVDVRDAARAMVAVALRGRPGLIYHVGTGNSRSVGEGLDLLIRASGRTVKVCPDPVRQARRGPSDSRAAIGRIIAHTGWSPVLSFEQSLVDLWESTRESVKATGGRDAVRLPLTA
jgi:GDP-4-dehydro-6-deoxy-D-mannose reductase